MKNRARLILSQPPEDPENVSTDRRICIGRSARLTCKPQVWPSSGFMLATEEDGWH
jgi:hypothetical protein